MPILIFANLMDWGTKSPLNVYLWREHPNLMRVSLVILGLLALNAMVGLAAHYGSSCRGSRRLAPPWCSASPS